MIDLNTVRQPPASFDEDQKRIWEQEERAMREIVANLPPPPSPEEIARAQGISPGISSAYDETNP